MQGGYCGKIAVVDLTTGVIEVEPLSEETARGFIGGYGLGARLSFERQAAGADPLGPGNILGFTTGPLTGTKAPTGGRYMACAKSPLTGGWGDANSGGHFGSELKAAGFDALFVTGRAETPCMLWVTPGRIEIRDASRLWGRDTVEAEAAIQAEFGDPKIRVAAIGPASERLSLISGIVNDRGRIAARSGLGAVMGAKRLKAVAVRGGAKVPVADAAELARLSKAFSQSIKDLPGMAQALVKHGTCGFTSGLIASGATPVKNWQLAGEAAFPTAARIADGDAVIRHQTRKYACASCPIACGGICEVTGGKYPVGEVHKPEYETIGAFGPLCLCDDLEVIIKLHDMCNRSGLDTISAGTVIAFAMECFEKGILSRTDLDGIALRWGDGAAMVALLDKMIRREGIGDLLADGVRAAAARIGGEAAQAAMHVGGQEPGLHNALFLPSRGTGFVCDPTPGRHTAAPMARVDGGPGAWAPYPELAIGKFERYAASGKGPISAVASKYLQVGNCAGVCLMPMMFFGNYPLLELVNAATGWSLDVAEALETGWRIQTLRQCFNLREGVRAADVRLPARLRGIPPQASGPLAGVTIDIDTLAAEFRAAMGWDPETAAPTRETLARLGLSGLVTGTSGAAPSPEA
jgi:aldehyde:ferredoxin oxidoreductase